MPPKMDFLVDGTLTNVFRNTALVWCATAAVCLKSDNPAMQTGLLVGTLLTVVSGLVLMPLPKVRSTFWTLNTMNHWVEPVPIALVDHVLKTAKPNNPMSAVEAIDDFCWNKGMFLMNVGDVKGAIVDKVLLEAKPKMCMELGAFLGYSSLRFAAHLPEGGVLHSVDPDPMGRAVSSSLIAFAGVQEKIVQHYDYSGNVLKKMAEKGIKLDFLFIDHIKSLYLPDLKLALSLGVLNKGCMVVADNVLFPGAPDYKEWILEQPNFKTVVHDTMLEYSKHRKDQVLVSEYLGN